MRRLALGAIALSLVLAACNGETPAPEPDTGGQAEEIRTEFVSLPGSGELAFTNGCIDGDTLSSDLPGGGVFRLRGSGDDVIVDLLPEAGADPLSSRTPGDTEISYDDDGFATGTSTVSTEEGGNSLDVSFQVAWNEGVPVCAEGGGETETEGFQSTALFGNLSYTLRGTCSSASPGFQDIYATMEASTGSEVLTLHLELAETNEGSGVYAEVPEMRIGGPIDDHNVADGIHTGSGLLTPEDGGEGVPLVFALEATDLPACD